MNLLADESVERPIVERLRQEGHDVVYVAELSPSIKDDEVLRQANDRVALLMTADKDFGELIHREGKIHAGIILLRLAGLSNATKADAVAKIIRERAAELPGGFTVISPGTVRTRKSQTSTDPTSGTAP